MTPALLFKVVAIALFAIGLYGMAAQLHLVRKILALNLMSAGVFLFLVSAAAREDAAGDPVPHAMVITGLVVSISATALALALASRVHRDLNRIELHWNDANQLTSDEEQ